jgi:hypothetical protein
MVDMTGREEREAFVPFYSEEPNDDLLSVLKNEANRLIRRATAMKPLLALVEKYNITLTHHT